MTKTISSDLQTHIAQPVTQLARMWKIVRTDGTSFFFTSLDSNLTFNGDLYVAATGFNNPTALENQSDMSVDNMEIGGIFDDDSITIEDLRAGRFDYADVYFFLVNWSNLAQGALQLRRGKLGEVVASSQGWFNVELRGMTQLLQQQIIELYGPECRADLGDARCTIPLDPPLRQNSQAYAEGDFIRVATDTGAVGQAMFENKIYQCTTAGTSDASVPTYDTTDGATTTDGSAVFTAQEAWTRSGSVTSITDSLNVVVSVTESRDVDNWFQYGTVQWDTGNNTGRALEIKNWDQSTNTVTFYVPAGYPVQIGDLFAITPGCDKSLDTCRDKFDNILNMRAEPYLPGDDAAFDYPDATN